ncbi:DUF3617 domain-containing protein [Hyphomonas sp.]|uniref:DUF3617 domain-containing protein n=1 Tax=Hyphomonas sp. TaxID=87 RepID=UPI00391D216E
MIRHAAAAAALAITFAGAAGAGPVPLSMGEWAVDLSFEFLGDTEADAFTECLLEEESNMEVADLVIAMSGGEECTAQDVVHKDGAATLRISCAVQEGMSGGTFAVKHTPETLSITGKVDITSPEWDTTMPANMSIIGYRAGACPAE